MDIWESRKAVMVVLLLVIKSMNACNTKVAYSACQCFRIVVILVSDCVDHDRLPNLR